MNDLELQKFLRSNSIEQLQEQYGIKCSVSEEFPELHLFKYSQIDSPMGEKIVQESRGIILNKDDDWKVVARPYDKFFNYGEGHASKIDWSTATCYDKLDGSLVVLYYYKDRWRAATSGNPDAAGEVWNELGKKIKFKELFWRTWNKLRYKVPTADGGESRFAHFHGGDAHKQWEHYTFMFELMTPFNKVVVQHKTDKLVLHGVRSIKTGRELCIKNVAELFGWDSCRTFPLYTIEDVIARAATLNPTDNEGYVVVDINFNRIKVKSPQYVALHHMRDTLSPRSMLEVIRTNESEEFLLYFPEFKPLYDSISVDYKRLRDTIQHSVDIYRELVPNWKQIGLQTKDIFYQGMIFNCLRNHLNVSEALRQLPIKKLEDWINKC